MSGTRRFDLRLDSEERAALQRISRERGISATAWVRSLIRRAAGLRSIFDDERLIGDDIGEDSPRSNGQLEGNEHGEQHERERGE